MQNALTSTSGKTMTRTSPESDSLYSSGLTVTDRLPRDEEKILEYLEKILSSGFNPGQDATRTRIFSTADRIKLSRYVRVILSCPW
jgi:hypothetical protein